jgi:hypothetical protein
MATINYYVAADMANPKFQFSGTISLASPSHCTFTNLNITQEVYGLSLTDDGSTLTGGTITQLDYWVNGTQEYSITNLNLNNNVLDGDSEGSSISIDLM